MKEPSYISIILDTIRINSYTEELEDKLIENSFSIHRGKYGLEISYKEGKSFLENKDLLEKLFQLNEMGVLFGEDYKQMYSPAAFMRELQTRGILKKDFKSIYWSGPGEFHIKENQLF